MPADNFKLRVSLRQKVVTITGANRGIGLGIAQVFLVNWAKMVYSLDLVEPGEEYAGLQKPYSNVRYI